MKTMELIEYFYLYPAAFRRASSITPDVQPSSTGGRNVRFSRTLFAASVLALSAAVVPGAAQASAPSNAPRAKDVIDTEPYIITRATDSSDRLLPAGWSATTGLVKAWGGGNPGYDEAWEVEDAGRVITDDTVSTTHILRFRRSENMCLAVYGDTKPSAYLQQVKCDKTDPAQRWILRTSPSDPGSYRIVPVRDTRLAVGPEVPVAHDTWVTLQRPGRNTDWRFDEAVN